jgi:hypothetical protein
MRRVKSCPELQKMPNRSNLVATMPPPAPTGMRHSTSTNALPLFNDHPVSQHAHNLNLIAMIEFELSIPAPAISIGQCHLAYGFPDEILHGDDETKKAFSLCALTPMDPPEQEKQLTDFLKSEMHKRLEYDERFAARYAEWLKRLRKNRFGSKEKK